MKRRRKVRRQAGFVQTSGLVEKVRAENEEISKGIENATPRPSGIEPLKIPREFTFPRTVGPVNYSVEGTSGKKYPSVGFTLAEALQDDAPNHGIDGGGIRKDTFKLRFSLLPARALAWIAAVFTGGAYKYAPRNWERGMAWSKHMDALERHYNKFKAGEDIDADSGLPHLAHVGFGVLALLTYAETCPQFDDRAKPSNNTLYDIEYVAAKYAKRQAEEAKCESSTR